MKNCGIDISVERESLLSEHAKKLLKDFYLLPSETLAQEAYARACVAWSGGDMELAQRLYDAVSQNWFVFASPVLSNAPSPGELSKGLPISCYLGFVGDTLKDLISHTTEIRWLSVKGGGVGGHWSAVRAVSDIAPGPIPFIHTVDADMIAYRQGKTRKGSYAAYLDISHPDIVEFINIRVPTGDANRKCLNLHHGVNVTDDFMNAVRDNLDWNLIDPKTKEVRDTLKARSIWEQLLETRYRTGEPYLCFIDTANKALPQQLKDLGLRINGSNLCVSGNTNITILLDDETILDINIEELEKYLKNGLVQVYSFNIERKICEFKPIINFSLMSSNSKVMKITDENGMSITCTPEHKIYTKNRGYVLARELLENDELLFDE